MYWVDQLVFNQIASSPKYPEHYDCSLININNAAISPNAKLAGRNSRLLPSVSILYLQMRTNEKAVIHSPIRN